MSALAAHGRRYPQLADAISVAGRLAGTSAGAVGPPPPLIAPRSSAITRALLAHLKNDSALRALLPDGVWKNSAPPGARQFALVDIFDSSDRGVFGGRAIEDVLYGVQAVVLSSSPGDAVAAWDRLDALLSEATLAVEGYTFMACYRDDDRPLIDYDEQNRTDPSLIYRHVGGHYRVHVSVPGR